MFSDFMEYYQEEIEKDDKAMNVSDEEFFMTPKWLMCRPLNEVPYSAKCVYGVLKTYCSISMEYGNGYFTWVSNATIAQDIGARSKTTVEKATKKLLDLGLIGRIRRKGEGKGFFSTGNVSSVHYLRRHQWMDDFAAAKAFRAEERAKLLERHEAIYEADAIRRQEYKQFKPFPSL